jgi:hypothetical protein
MRLSLVIVSILILTSTVAYSAQQPIRDLYSDTWVGSDALGRKMPVFADVGAVKKDQRRVVGIFYITWHSDSNHDPKKTSYGGDVSKILATDPSARLDARNPLWTEAGYHWGEPEAGYFLSKDEYVIRKDMSMLADAGVDVLVMDVTNAVRYWDEWDTVFPVMQRMKAEGNKVPQFCFWAFNGPVVSVVQDLYDKVYKEGKYKDLWYTWDGKPLLLYNGNPAADANGLNPNSPEYSKEVKDFFTLRTMWWGYYEWAGKRFVGTEDNWSFGLDMADKRVSALKPEDRVSLHKGKREEAAVTPGQHASSFVGKSWTVEKGEPLLNNQDLPISAYVPWLGKTVEHPEDYGIYFQQRFDEAIRSNPQFLYINDWNEWTAGKYPPPPGQKFDFMRRKSDFFFVDQYNAEFTRCIQPMKGGYTDNYYMQMAQNIRRYKGVRPIPESRGYSSIKIDGDAREWKQVKVEYRDTVGDTIHRDYNGYGGLHYKNDSGRNDIIAGKVAVDRKNVYFLAETNDPLTPHTGKNWMLLLIDADKNPKTGWYGYDYLINQDILNSKTTTIKRFDTKSRSWTAVAKLGYAYKGNTLELAVPRKILGLKGSKLTFDFHWCDNPAELKDPISLCVNGDSAPNRRFNYRCIWRE